MRFQAKPPNVRVSVYVQKGFPVQSGSVVIHGGMFSVFAVLPARLKRSDGSLALHILNNQGLHYITVEHNDSQKRMIIGLQRGFSSLTHRSCVYICVRMSICVAVFCNESVFFSRVYCKEARALIWQSLKKLCILYILQQWDVFEPHKDYHRPMKAKLLKNLREI